MQFNFKKMFYMKTLSYMASREVYYQCYKIIEDFIHSFYWCCLCDRYQGCRRGPYPVARNDYCYICITYSHYILGKLNNVKYNSFQLERFYLNILRDLAEILRVDPTACFWENELFYKYRNWQEGTESQTCLRDVIDTLFVINE